MRTMMTMAATILVTTSLEVLQEMAATPLIAMLYLCTRPRPVAIKPMELLLCIRQSMPCTQFLNCCHSVLRKGLFLKNVSC